MPAIQVSVDEPSYYMAICYWFVFVFVEVFLISSFRQIDIRDGLKVWSNQKAARIDRFGLWQSSNTSSIDSGLWKFSIDLPVILRGGGR